MSIGFGLRAAFSALPPVALPAAPFAPFPAAEPLPTEAGPLSEGKA